jgi:hypothetical protein
MPLLNILAALLLKIAVNIVMFCTYCFYNFIRKHMVMFRNAWMQLLHYAALLTLEYFKK